ncbi:ATP-binding protein [Streptomyces sp. NBC_01728]|uniref:ATP-binding protein n=1 Tax=unclassified Streptomyces TaxID=2593676 RepID=UPI002255214F|nr:MULTISPECIES: ATP-binding protein [unclassified Streptomyces]MCX4455759.1 ATP-binding protein [Streptomyces sp. NBC_01719]MCX4495119.1 ATP-binding protein [Streptomyces sp. NBC_01728]
MAAHQLTLSVPATSTAVTAARHQAVDAIAGWKAELDDEVVHTAELVISELVTNAVRHAGTGHVSMTVRLIATVLRIEVCDSSPVLPQLGLPDECSENGRGLFLVAALADQYGAEPTSTGKRCWAEIALPTSPDQKSAVSLPLQRS